ncbi:hypothetical protein V2J09_003126 [Rumex salicifolius]
MIAIRNIKLLEGIPEAKKSSSGVFSLKFDINKKKDAARKERTGEQAQWQLSRFYPVVEDLIEKLAKGELPRNDYPCMNDPSPTVHRSNPASYVQVEASAVSRRTRHATWARPRNSDDGYSSDSLLRHASSDVRRMGQRIFIFIVGGATRSEVRLVFHLRACHKLSTKLKREIILGSSSIDDPVDFITVRMKPFSSLFPLHLFCIKTNIHVFMQKLKMLPNGEADDLSLDDMRI